MATKKKNTTTKKKATKRLAKVPKRNQTTSQVKARSVRAGKTWERQVANLFKEAGFPAAKRGARQSRSGSEDPDVIGVPGWWIECKSGRCPSIGSAWNQAALANDTAARTCLAVRRTVRVAAGGKAAFQPMAVISRGSADRLGLDQQSLGGARFPWAEYAALRRDSDPIEWYGKVAFPLAWALEDGWFENAV